jgi:hypothetical protein
LLNVALLTLWRNAVRSGQLKTEFVANHDDDQHRWMTGDLIVLGVTESGAGPRHYATNLRTGKVINIVVEEKSVPTSDYLCQFNGYRRLQSGANLSRQVEVAESALTCGFFCQDANNPSSILRREPLCQIELKHHLFHAYHNLAPIDAMGHFIWIPVRFDKQQLSAPHYPQKLDAALIEDFFLLRTISSNLLLVFNSLQAGATVNHLHFQAIYRARPLAIEKQRATPCGPFHILNEYPATALMFRGSESIVLVTEQVMRLQEAGVPFNLLSTDEAVFLIPRNSEGEVTAELPSDRLSALDVSGRIVTVYKNAYDSITKERIEAALRTTGNRDHIAL